jgi:hypothetical protein
MAREGLNKYSCLIDPNTIAEDNKMEFILPNLGIDFFRKK